MATGALVSEQEYLSTNYKPGCDYIDGVLRQKSMPTLKHSVIAGQLSALINSNYPQVLAGPELTVRVRTGMYLVPDVAVQRRDHLQDPYPEAPILLCVEILSPSDSIGETFTKCEEYHAWGVEVTWVVDPETRQAWIFRKGHRPIEVPPDGTLNAEEISISLRDLFVIL